MASTTEDQLPTGSEHAAVVTPDRDLCAVFQTSFHPTKGNVIDFAAKTSDAIELDGVEFSTLPSGLHVVDEDVIYFSKGAREGVCIFRRTKTQEEGMRGYRLGALGVLLEPSKRARPWLHVANLRKLSDGQESKTGDFTELQTYFEKYQAAHGVAPDFSDDQEEELRLGGPAHPLLHLPHILRLLGANGLLFYKFALARKRILIYTHPAVEPACMLAICARAMAQVREGPGADADGLPVLGLVGLMDIDRLKAESDKGKGWIACTTDAIFLERPQLFDLILDLTTTPISRASSTPTPSTTSPPTPPRPAFHLSHRLPYITKPSAAYTLRPARFTWSDLALWSALDRILRASEQQAVSATETKWGDPWRVYEEVCTMCAGVLASGWKGSGGGEVRLEGEDEVLRKQLRRASASSGSIPSRRRTMEVASPKSPTPTSPGGTPPCASETTLPPPPPTPQALTLALLSQIHTHSAALLSDLSLLLSSPSPPQSSTPTAPPTANPSPSKSKSRWSNNNLGSPGRTLTPRDLVGLRLGALSAADAKWVEWLAIGRLGRRVVVRRTWWDLTVGLLGW